MPHTIDMYTAVLVQNTNGSTSGQWEVPLLGWRSSWTIPGTIHDLEKTVAWNLGTHSGPTGGFKRPWLTPIDSSLHTVLKLVHVCRTRTPDNVKSFWATWTPQAFWGTFFIFIQVIRNLDSGSSLGTSMKESKRFVSRVGQRDPKGRNIHKKKELHTYSRANVREQVLFILVSGGCPLCWQSTKV